MSLKNPNWNNTQDRAMYNELFYGNKNYEELTEEEEDFCKTMYIFEEYACHLDGFN